jgi:AhpD family alkylhydroperoxidase
MNIMSERLDYIATAPVGIKALRGAYTYVKECSLGPQLIEMVFLRTSQINGCAYCIDAHSRSLMKRGMSVDKVVMVPAWREAGPLFDAREKAALAWAEVVTRISETGAPDEDYAAMAAQFTERERVDLTMAISIMNTYNRLAISFRKIPTVVAEAIASGGNCGSA